MFCGVIANHWNVTANACSITHECFASLQVLNYFLRYEWINSQPMTGMASTGSSVAIQKCCGIILFDCTGNCSTGHEQYWDLVTKAHIFPPSVYERERALLSHLCQTLLACLQCQTDFPSPDGPASPFPLLPCPFLLRNHRHKFVSL